MILLLVLFLLLPVQIYAARDSSKLQMDEEEQAVSADVSAKVDEIAKPVEPVKATEPVKVAEPAKVTEPAKTPEPVKIPEKTLAPAKPAAELLPQVSDNIEIVNIRTAWYAKEKRERIVVDISANKEPAAYRNRIGDNLSINVEASIGQDKCKHFTKLLQQTHYINSAQIVYLDDEKEVLIQLFTKKGVREKILTLAAPARLVIDLEPSFKRIKKVK
jgi:hypothetical protein